MDGEGWVHGRLGGRETLCYGSTAVDAASPRRVPERSGISVNIRTDIDKREEAEDGFDGRVVAQGPRRLDKSSVLGHYDSRGGGLLVCMSVGASKVHWLGEDEPLSSTCRNYPRGWKVVGREKQMGALVVPSCQNL